LVNKAAALTQNVSQEDIVTIALREFIDRHKPKTEKEMQCSPKIIQGDKTIDPMDLFGLWKDHPKQLSDIRKQAWQRFGLEK